MIKYIVTAVVLMLVWAAVVLLELPWWIALVPTVLAVATFAGLFTWQRVKARNAAADIEKSLKAQGDAQLQQVRPDQQAEIEAMQAEFAKAIASLKSSKLARGKRDALSILPWYLIIGPPGAGKSTALRKSGLQFPYLSTRGGGVKGVGGTRNCEWWLTNEAVILDTAGRYTTEDDDQEEWFSFLETLARHRPRRPINGLIVAVSTQDLLGMEGEGVTQLGERIRERVNEVTQRLGMVVPVYVLVTKCDLMAGFVEAFSHLSRTDRGQIWGFTLPLEAREASTGEVVQRNLDELAGVLDELCLKRIGEERHPDARERIFGFPHQFDALRAPLTELIEALFAENVYTDAPIMRGVYFTSGTQEGKLIDRLIGSMVEAFGIRRQVTAATAEPGVETRSYFLRDLFSNVIFKDQNLAVRSSAEVHRQKLLQYGYAAAGVALALLLLSLPTIAYFENRAMLKSFRALVQAPTAQQAKGLDALAALTPVGERLGQVLRAEEEGAPWSLRMGMYQGSRILPALRAYYGGTVRRALVEPLLDADSDQLAEFARASEPAVEPLAGGEYARFHDKLRLHLLATGPRAEGEPGLTEAEREWFVRHVVARWSRSPRVARDAQFAKDLQAHVELFARLSATDPSLASPRNPQLVKDVRRKLGTVPAEMLALEKLLADPALDQFELSVGHILGGSTSRIRGEARVRGAFTRKGYDAVVKARLSDADGADAWVLGTARGRSMDEQIAQRAAALRSRYFGQYIEEWKAFLADLRYEHPGSTQESLVMLEDLTRGKPPPLGLIFRSVALNTRIVDRRAEDGLVDGIIEKGRKQLQKQLKLKKEEGAILAGGVKDKLRGDAPDEVQLTEADVEREFDPLVRFGIPAEIPDGPDAPPPAATALDRYHEQLEGLRDALRASLENPEAKGPLQARLETARVQVASLINAQPSWRPRLEALLMPPLEGATKSAVRARVAQVNDDWCSSVVSTFEQSLAKRYPFAKSAHDAALADVAEFYRRDRGVVWSFYNASLSGEVKRVGQSFALADEGKSARAGYGGQLLAFLNTASLVTDALFAQGAAEPQVQFSVQIQPVLKASSVIFAVDGHSVEYRNGPEEWHSFRWPGDGKTFGASLKVRNSRGVSDVLEQEGEWGLFRLLEAGAVQAQPGARVFTVTWKVPTLDTEVTINFRPQRSDTPFFGRAASAKPTLLAPFRTAAVVPPRTVGAGGGGCAQ